MNGAAIQKKLAEYYSKVTPEQILREFEALGVEFVNTPEVRQIEFDFGIDFPFEFNTASQSWADKFLVELPNAVPPAGVYSNMVAPPPIQKDTTNTAGNTQFAMAA